MNGTTMQAANDKARTATKPDPAVLVVDDDPAVCRLVADALESRGNFTVSQAHDADTARRHFSADDPDLVVLDLGLPGVDGVDVLRELRSIRDVPVIILTARGDEADRVLGLERGADDYIVKPFSPRELVARVRTVLRRVQPQPQDTGLVFDGLSIDVDAREVRIDGAVIALTAKEFDLLAFLASSPRRAFTRAQLLEHVWKSNVDWQDVSTVTEHIRRLRRKIEPDPKNPRWITTLPGVGYRFEA